LIRRIKLSREIKINSLEKELQEAEKKVKNIQEEIEEIKKCKHEWNNIEYDERITGEERNGYDYTWYYPRWKRTCKLCNLTQYTEEYGVTSYGAIFEKEHPNGDSIPPQVRHDSREMWPIS
jgi:Tfp pilus assembly protein PilX